MSRPLHVGLDLVYLTPDSGGSGTYARELIRALRELEPETRITAWVGRGAPAELPDGVDWVRLPVRSTGSPVHVPVELFWLGLDARRRGVDLVHGLAYATPVIAPGVATLVTLLDMTWRHHPESVTRLARAMFEIFARTCGRSADRVIAISEAARDDLVATLHIEPGRIDVTPLGVGAGSLAEPVPEHELRERLGIPGAAPVLLSVAQLAAHKNLGVLVDALPLLPGSVAVIPGRRLPYADSLVARATELGVGERLVLPGFVDASTLEGLYALARVFVLPSLFEGFGLPVLEAMRRGVPVACSDIPVLREVAGDSARYFDPRDPAAVAAAVQDPPDPEPARRRAAEFTWERTARLTLDAYRRALDGRR